MVLVLSKNINIKMYTTIIVPVSLCERETCSLTLRENCRLRMCENRALKRIFGPRKDEVRMEWRKLQHFKA